MATAEDHATAAAAMFNLWATDPGQLGGRSPADWLAAALTQAVLAVAVELGVPPTDVNVEMPALASAQPAATQPPAPGG